MAPADNRTTKAQAAGGTAVPRSGFSSQSHPQESSTKWRQEGALARQAYDTPGVGIASGGKVEIRSEWARKDDGEFGARVGLVRLGRDQEKFKARATPNLMSQRPFNRQEGQSGEGARLYADIGRPTERLIDLSWRSSHNARSAKKNPC